MNETEIRDRLADVAADAPTAFTAPSHSCAAPGVGSG